MDDQLKQRLIGASVIVALIVTFVPMMFDESPHRETELTVIESGDGPAAEGREADSGANPAGEEPGYRIIPLNEEGVAETPPDKDPIQTSPAAPTPTELIGDEGADTTELPTPDSPLGAGRGSDARVEKPLRVPSSQPAEVKRAKPESSAPQRESAKSNKPKKEAQGTATAKPKPAAPKPPGATVKPKAEVHDQDKARSDAASLAARSHLAGKTSAGSELPESKKAETSGKSSSGSDPNASTPRAKSVIARKPSTDTTR